MLDLIVRGGTVVTPGATAALDVGIDDGKIVAVTQPGNLPDDAARIIDAAGRIVLPGGIEPHAHIAERVQASWAGRRGVLTQSPQAATRAAAFGGVTTVIDFAGPIFPWDGDRAPTISDSLDARRQTFAGNSYIDFSFHYMLFGEVPPETIAEIGDAVTAGVASFKIFTINRHTRVPYGHLGGIFDEVAKQGAIMAVHAEEQDVVDYMRQKLIREGRDQGYNLPYVHSNLSEDLSFRTVTRLAEHSGVAVYFVHTTAKEGVAAIADARDAGLPVYGEALHNYMHFTADDYKGPNGTAIHTYPAIKFADDRDALIAGLLDGRISTTATDEYTTNKEIKLSGDTIESVCGGHNGIETRIPVAFTKLVQERGMSLNRFADVAATNAAKILGLYPRKGAILPGSDADLCLLDPDLNKTIALDDLHADSDYSIWEGYACRGYPVMTILRGKVIVEDGDLLGDTADGEWLPRKVDPDVLARPAL